jgi:hypothetical protein
MLAHKYDMPALSTYSKAVLQKTLPVTVEDQYKAQCYRKYPLLPALVITSCQVADLKEYLPWAFYMFAVHIESGVLFKQNKKLLSEALAVRDANGPVLAAMDRVIGYAENEWDDAVTGIEADYTCRRDRDRNRYAQPLMLNSNLLDPLMVLPKKIEKMNDRYVCDKCHDIIEDMLEGIVKKTFEMVQTAVSDPQSLLLDSD